MKASHGWYIYCHASATYGIGPVQISGNSVAHYELPQTIIPSPPVCSLCSPKTTLEIPVKCFWAAKKAKRPIHAPEIEATSSNIKKSFQFYDTWHSAIDRVFTFGFPSTALFCVCYFDSAFKAPALPRPMLFLHRSLSSHCCPNTPLHIGSIIMYTGSCFSVIKGLCSAGCWSIHCQFRVGILTAGLLQNLHAWCKTHTGASHKQYNSRKTP